MSLRGGSAQLPAFPTVPAYGMWDTIGLHIFYRAYPFSEKHLFSTPVLWIIMHLLVVHVFFVAFAISQSLPTVDLGYEVHRAIALNVPTKQTPQLLNSMLMRFR